MCNDRVPQGDPGCETPDLNLVFKYGREVTNLILAQIHESALFDIDPLYPGSNREQTNSTHKLSWSHDH